MVLTYGSFSFVICKRAGSFESNALSPEIEPSQKIALGFCNSPINGRSSKVTKLPRVNRVTLGLMAHYEGELIGVLVDAKVRASNRDKGLSISAKKDTAVVDVTVEPLKQTKWEKSKEPQALAKEVASLKYRARLQEDVTTRMEEQSSVFLQTVSLLEKGLYLMEKDIVAAMATFRHRLEQFKVNLARRNDERGARDVLLQDIGAQVKEVEDLMTREALPEWTESDHGKPPKTSKAKGGEIAVIQET
uniref:Uncharacterized protein n=1 Tax=Ananas comosus var. bracteatus TaxID=296719 RepID=A0A6V7PRG8_ANACO|nr:unnamed protein product [Ananas comosus var. bracteatus]